MAGTIKGKPRLRNSSKITARLKKHFLDVLRQSGRPSLAAKSISTKIAAVYMCRRRDEQFRQGWEEAVTDYKITEVDLAEEALHRRAIVGVQEDVYYKGKKVGRKTRYSDSLLLAYLRANKPELFGDQTKVTHDGEIVTRGELVILPPLDKPEEE